MLLLNKIFNKLNTKLNRIKMNTTTLPKSLSVKSKVIINKSSHIFNKLVYYVGLFVISIIIISLSLFILESYSINLLQPFYIKTFCIFCITILSILNLDYLLKYCLYIYFNNNKQTIINNKLPKLIYNYLYNIKSISKIEISLKNYYLYYFLIYFIILLIYIFIYFKTPQSKLRLCAKQVVAINKSLFNTANIMDKLSVPPLAAPSLPCSCKASKER